MSALRVATRRSALALRQSQAVADEITRLTGREVELLEVVSEGDRSSASLLGLGGQGVFVSALRDAVLDGRADLAVHSYKDLPTAPNPGLVVAAVPPREDPRDALVARDGLTLGELPAGSRIGTGSPRRAAQLRALGLGLEVVDLRGNVDTRLRAVEEGRLDAVVLARAGLVRLGRAEAATEVLDPLQMLPAPAQGALAVECGAGSDLIAELQPLDDPHSRAAVTAERALLAALEAGCSAPVGALADVAEGLDDLPSELYLRAAVIATDGSEAVRLSATATVDQAEQLGRRLAADLLAAGAHGLMGERIP